MFVQCFNNAGFDLKVEASMCFKSYNIAVSFFHSKPLILGFFVSYILLDIAKTNYNYFPTASTDMKKSP